MNPRTPYRKGTDVLAAFVPADFAATVAKVNQVLLAPAPLSEAHSLCQA